MTDHIFEIDCLTHQYPDGKRALNNLNLNIKLGKKIALLGNNGAGKSTLFLHLNGLLQPSSGRISYKGLPMRYDRKSLLSLRRQVGIVFQNPDIQLFSANVRQDISFGPINLGFPLTEVHEKVNWAMKQTDVLDLEDKPTHFLSLGQKKRVAIAGILAMDPDVWILDEPTAGLDSYYSRQIVALLDSLHQPEKTIILSTHDVNLAYEWADEIIIMNDGNIIYQGDPVNIFHQEHLLLQAYLEKPWVFETFQSMIEAGLADHTHTVPRNKEELFQRMECKPIPY
ncbi:energy-coupling factor ABC transporter ATP-binding protein [Bacillus sp. T3]|uniref:energy-coupling factor ABC transporter ATP-binding protein n=1 Tax=Bacillus sp. T3 TaxID=467262 RepID=UPI002981EC4D|nr:ATP-binding cassette domain-containing protein [Bacillus sp. T3]